MAFDPLAYFSQGMIATPDAGSPAHDEQHQVVIISNNDEES